MKKIKFLIVSMAVLMACTGRTADQRKIASEEGIQFKVAAYNVEFSRNATAQEIGEAFKPYDFDIVCFSEAPGGGWTKEVADALGFSYVIVGRYSTAGHKDKYKSIASRTPLYNYEEILMADTLHTATKANTKIGGREISVYSVHFPFGWRDQAHIDETTGKIVSFINHLKERQNNEIVLIMGDFNFTLSNSESKSPYYDLFVDNGFEASWKDLSFDVSQRNTIGSDKTKSKGRVIDHIMYNPEKIRAIDGDIIEMDKPLSDHKPVWALLQIKKQKK